MNMPSPKPLWSASEIAAAQEVHISHPWNPNSEIHVKPLSASAGLSRVVLSLARVPPGRESFVYHSHERDEEFLFILSGRGRAEIGEEVFEVGPGDFMGFPAPGSAHHLTNPYGEDLVYLMGGERSGLDVGHFPRLKRRIVFSQTGINAVDESALQPMAFEDFIVKP
jgi:uncharacterized cupin superfamily protein